MAGRLAVARKGKGERVQCRRLRRGYRKAATDDRLVMADLSQRGLMFAAARLKRCVSEGVAQSASSTIPFK